MNTATHHLVWDWNGTLFNDAAATLAATNDIFAPYGITLTATQYRAIFRRPLADFYIQALGKKLTLAELEQLDNAFHTAYRIRMQQCALAADAKYAIARWSTTGRTQSLLSLWNHVELVELVEQLGLTGHFLTVQGRYQPIEGKAGLLIEHLDDLGISATGTTLIGDSLDDAAAAQAIGAHCILLNAGTHEPEALFATGYPVVDSLTAAVTLLAQS